MTNRFHRPVVAFIAVAAVLSPATAVAMQAEGEEAPAQLVTALHVHSTASTGDETVGELMQRAAAGGIDVLVLNENFGYEFRYAPRIVRLFVEASIAAPTVEGYGLDRYLAELEAARRGPTNVLLLPGVEVPPYYYWSGGLLSGDLTLNDMQRNLLILPPVGASTAVDTAGFIAGLPAVGNRLDRRFGWRSLVLLLPGLLLVTGALRASLRRSPAADRPRVWPWLIAGLAGAALLWLNFPFRVAAVRPYDTDAGVAPAQRLIDYTEERGGLAFWSMPEAVDDRRQTVGPVSVHLSTRPYPEALAASSGYAGFGGVYADTTRVWDAGGVWDRVLAAYARGDRESPPWLVGESAYHYAGQAGKQLGDVLTVLLAGERTETEVFRALARGRAYALRRDGDAADLRLREFAAVGASATDRGAADPGIGDTGAGGAGTSIGAAGTASGNAVARLGDTLLLPPGAPAFELVLALEEATGLAAAVRVEVVRNGEVTRRFDGTTPLRERWSETLREDETAAYYRIVVRGAHPAHLVSNPIFVRRGGGAADPVVVSPDPPHRPRGNVQRTSAGGAVKRVRRGPPGLESRRRDNPQVQR